MTKKSLLILLKRINNLLGKLPGKYGRIYVDLDSGRDWLLKPHLIMNERNRAIAYHLGRKTLDWLTVHTGFPPTADILDAGCGDGRVAAAFAGSDFSGNYYGFDINKSRIEALNSLFSRKKNYHFTHADIFHSYYNPKGIHPPEGFIYPYPDNSLDLVFYNSIFTHMKLEVIRHNLEEAARCLKKDGRIWASFFLIEPDHNPHKPGISWRFLHNYDRGYTATPQNPEKCVAYDIETIGSALEGSGFTLTRHIPGTWKGNKTSLDQHEHDVLVAMVR